MPCGRLLWTFPNSVREDFKVLEGSAPGFHGIRIDPRVPVQFVNGKVVMFDRRQHACEAHVLHMGDRFELRLVETHRYAPRYLSTESPGIKIRNFQAAVVDLIAARAGEPGRMKVVIRKRDVLRGIASAALKLVSRELSFSSQINPPRWHRGFPQRFPEIQQFDPAPVPETPIGIREVVHFRLCIEMRVSGAKYSLFECESIAPNSELRRQTHGQRRVAPRCELQGLPVQVAEVQRTIQRAAGVQIEPQISPMHGDGSLRVVAEDPPVSQYQAPDAQSE